MGNIIKKIWKFIFDILDTDTSKFDSGWTLAGHKSLLGYEWDTKKRKWVK